METLHNILVRDFTAGQKKKVEAAAVARDTSTSRFIRDASVKVAEDMEKAQQKAAAKKKTPK